MQNTDNWYVYMIRCRDGSLYTGIATDVERRFAEHQSNVGAKYLRGRGPLTLVFKQRIGQRSWALKVEQGIKRLPKKKKEALVETGAGVKALISNRKL
ncbi:MAG: GIY-YIG nuclease family protein [Phycisphaerae bacterium]|nr:GIY-YIG nuclease family protein [Phycisphaerae bacterium]NIV00229.1 GIY-YIG nuclease family protein [Phycisphaerae bacterium]NIX29712.1 GIY-YIG nuclease family protein [Phycisphaerae bacterium]